MLNIVKKIITNPEKVIFGFERLGLFDWIDDETYLKIIYYLIYKRKLNLRNPAAYTEKIAWYKLHWRNPLAKKCVDKYEVREYVKEKIDAKHIIQCYGVWDKFDDINFNLLPNKFVLKPTNGSGDIYICNDKKNIELEKVKSILCQYKKRHFSSKTKEWAYYDIPFRILAEAKIDSSDGLSIKDYKFFCFNGQPRFLFVGSERDTDVKFDFFDLDWNWIPVRNGHEHNPNLKRPQQFSKMIEIACKLSQDFPHVRVDLYEENETVYFGELTFYHFGGITKFEPDEWDFKFGEYFDLSVIPSMHLV